MAKGTATIILSTRVPLPLREAVDAAVRAHQVAGTGPQTLTEALVAALQLWLTAEGMPLTAEAEEAVQSVRAVGRPKKPPFTLPEGTDAQALWNEFWTMAYTQGWTTAASWATQKYHTTIGGFDHAVRAALPADVRPTREELGLVSEREWIEQQVAAALGPGKGKGKT